MPMLSPVRVWIRSTSAPIAPFAKQTVFGLPGSTGINGVVRVPLSYAKEAYQSEIHYLSAFGCVFAFFVIANMYYKNAVLSQQIEQAQKVYVFSMEDALIKLGTVSLKQNFEKEVMALNNELEKNEKKIETIRNAKVRDDFSAVYMDSLKLKRDTLVQNYQKQLADLTEQINKALSEVAKKYDASTIFNAKSTVVKTSNVTDVTDEVVNIVKQ